MDPADEDSLKRVSQHLTKRQDNMDTVTTVGIDIAKNVFQVHGVDKKGRCILKKRLSREKLLDFMRNLEPVFTIKIAF